MEQKQEKVKKPSNLSRLLGYAGKHRYLTYASWVLSALSALLALVPFWYLWKMMQEVLEVMPEFEKAEHLVQNGWMAVLFTVLALLVYIGGLMCSHLAAFRIATNLRLTMLRHIQTLPLGIAEWFGSGKLRKIIQDSSAASENYLAHMLPDTWNAAATPVGLLVLLLVFDWRLGLLSLIPVGLGFLVMARMTGETMRKKMEEYQNALEDMSNEAVEYVRGIPVVKTFGQTVFSFRRFKGSIDRYQHWTIAYTKELRLPMMLYTTAINSVFVVLILVAMFLTRHGVSQDFLLDLLFYILITPVISLTLTKLMYMSENGMLVEDALKRMDSVLALQPLSVPAEGQKPKDASIVLHQVSYSYDGERKALDGVSLEILPGQVAAFVGPSGSGKTTAASLISRFLDAQEGEVQIGGVDVRKIPKEVLTDTISFVFQNSHLIKGTLLENVRLGSPDATEAQVLQALEQAQCLDIVEKLPDGIHTKIGSHGIYLSGGEQQRIAIARTILKNTPILVLDEATAFADPDHEERMQAALTALAKDKTILMIAHRLSTIAEADAVFVFQDGKIVEHGSAAELRKGNGLFRRMWDAYQTSVQWKVSKEDQA